MNKKAFVVCALVSLLTLVLVTQHALYAATVELRAGRLGHFYEYPDRESGVLYTGQVVRIYSGDTVCVSEAKLQRAGLDSIVFPTARYWFSGPALKEAVIIDFNKELSEQPILVLARNGCFTVEALGVSGSIDITAEMPSATCPAFSVQPRAEGSITWGNLFSHVWGEQRTLSVVILLNLFFILVSFIGLVRAYRLK